MILELKIETQLVNWNEIAKMCWSSDKNKYGRTKKRQQLFIKHEIRNQIDVENYFGDNNTAVYYEWHTSTLLDLGNMTAGEKFLADSINELGIWSDDRYIQEIKHKRIEDVENYVIMRIKGAKKK